LVSERPYKQAWSKQQALEFIEDQAGLHFDPIITQVFIEMMRAECIAQS